MIAKNEMRNTGKSNVVGRISEEEIFLIDYIKPWQKIFFCGKIEIKSDGLWFWSGFNHSFSLIYGYKIIIV